MYKVIEYFTDLQDGDHPYNVGDDFPREGKKVSEERIAELSSSANRRKKPLIALATSQDKTPAADTEEKKTGIQQKTVKKPNEVKKNGNSGSSDHAKSKSGKKKQPK